MREALARFGAASFRPGQREAVEALLSGRDTLCLFPTGSGKSLCYQLPAYLHEGLTLVVSPLIALMQDQVAHLLRLGIPAALLSSAQSREEQESIYAQLHTGRLKLLYVSPERLAGAGFLRRISGCGVWLLAVDEAHCVDRWGRDFRPEYRQIGRFVQALPKHPVLCAMTATADRRVLNRIIRSLGMRSPHVVRLPMTRPNLTCRVCLSPHPGAELIQAVQRQQGGQGIVYLASRKQADETAAFLRRNGISAQAYHAGLEAPVRHSIQNGFQQQRFQAVAATIAFGMGVDLPHIRWIAHLGLPGSAADYAQQIGRAGRDGQSSECVLLLSPDLLLRTLMRIQLIQKDKSLGFMQRRREVRRQWRDTQALCGILLGNRCIQSVIAQHFGQKEKACGQCSACRRTWRFPPVPRLQSLDRDSYRFWWLRMVTAWLCGESGCRMPDRGEMLEALRRGSYAPGVITDEALSARLCDWIACIQEIRFRS